ncbi:MAG: alkaline phosphatase [Planctomycetales bacterium]|nr:alkaline phosphatase [Planctomycetales bacterium]
MACRNYWLLSLLCTLAVYGSARSQDLVRELQKQADEQKQASWGHWGAKPNVYSDWTNHSNRLIPIYTFGIDLTEFAGEQSAYRNADKLQNIYGYAPQQTVNPNAEYLDQTDVYRLQQQAVNAGKKYVILMVFDGMDWQTTQAAAVYKSQHVYESGRGSGLLFQDYQGTQTDYGWFVSSPYTTGGDVDVNTQTATCDGSAKNGGYSYQIGGPFPWSRPKAPTYHLGQVKNAPHGVTDSASSATSMTAGIKTYNAAINVGPNGEQVVPIGRTLQAERNWSIGVVTSVPISHATPAAAYSNNVNRNDYQDLTKDLLGLRSVSHRQQPLSGVDVLIGCGWGETKNEDSGQGDNFVPGNRYFPETEWGNVDIEKNGKYRVAQRTPGKPGKQVLLEAAKRAYQENTRLFGFFGVTGDKGRQGGHLPYQTADGQYNTYQEVNDPNDIDENPTLADMTRAALGVLSKNSNGFWLMIEAGDVDWANHKNNLDNSIGAVLSGDDAFKMVISWVEKYDKWDETAVILTADHGHHLVISDPSVLIKSNTSSALSAK